MPTVKFQLRRDTAANWATVNPTLGPGEPALETDTRNVKYGDGATPWNSLPYASVGGTTFMQNLLSGSVDADDVRTAIGLNRSVFRANKNAVSQSLTGGSATKITFDTEWFDQNGYYDAGNSRYTPPPGPVIVRAQVQILSGFAAGERMFLVLRKNGVNWAIATCTFPTVNALSDSIELIDVANGTDYYEVYVNASTAGSTPVVDGSITATWFEGYSV